tara:strand:+ start:313 stop:588 length:276 start_codon:yes stop_codon:yes gene_type:complete
MIYTRCGAPIKLTSVRLGEVEGPRGKFETWFCRAELTGPYPDGSGKAGEALFDGQEIKAADDLIADGGWAEIDDACQIEGAKMLLGAINGK